MMANNKRWTKQMRTITDIIYNSNIHLTADEIFLEARKTMPSISLGTVYRNLKRFESQRLVAIVKKGAMNTYSKYPDSNAHFECLECHRLYCVPFNLGVTEFARKTGFTVQKCSIYTYGICKECGKAKKKEEILAGQEPI
jgi:Fur family peroxide stress response transcriptional regulator